MDKNYIKAYHRRAQANVELKNYLAAVEDFEYVLSQESGNNAVMKELNEAKKNLSAKDIETLNSKEINKEQE